MDWINWVPLFAYYTFKQELSNLSEIFCLCVFCVDINLRCCFAIKIEKAWVRSFILHNCTSNFHQYSTKMQMNHTFRQKYCIHFFFGICWNTHCKCIYYFDYVFEWAHHFDNYFRTPVADFHIVVMDVLLYSDFFYIPYTHL